MAMLAHFVTKYSRAPEACVTTRANITKTISDFCCRLCLPSLRKQIQEWKIFESSHSWYSWERLTWIWLSTLWKSVQVQKHPCQSSISVSQRRYNVKEFQIADAMCGKYFKSKRSLQIHLRDIHSDSDKKFSRELCFREFKSINSLHNHKSVYHR